MSTYEEKVQEILNDASISSHFKNVLLDFEEKDMMDALNEAELLLELMRMKLEELSE